jgi:phytoene dehydrogenase-like protein
MFRRLFLDHPATVGESYAEHFGVAGRFGMTMIKGGMGALVHAFVPALCKTHGSDTVAELHRQMVLKRGAVAADQVQMKTVEFII